MQRLLVALALYSIATALAAAESSRVAAAADLQVALQDIQADFHHHHPEYRVQITYGSSGIFASQLRQGAPFELYLSAHADYVDHLNQAGLTRDSGSDYALGRLAFYSRQPLAAETAEEALQAWQQAHPQGRLAIANPRHAPYGVAAIGWLDQLDVPLTTAQLVQGENAAQSVQFVLSGAASAGILAWPLIYPRDLSGQAWLIPADDHPPLRQRMVLMNSAGPAAEAFYQYLRQPQVIEDLQRFGFEAP